MRITRNLALTLACALHAASAFAQTTTLPQAAADARWAPWFGCWQLAEESVDDATQLLEKLPGSDRGSTGTRGAMLCVAPATGGGATITTVVNDQLVSSETMIVDGTERPLEDPACRGWRKAEWSNLGARVFTRTEIACGSEAPRTVTGIGSMAAGPLWLDIQMIESEGRKSLRVRRYRRAANQKHAAAGAPPLDVARMPLGGKLSIAEIKEAGGKVPAEVLQAAVIDLGAGGYDLAARQLSELDAAGVPGSVIDLMVAMSYPERFTVERPASGGGFSSMWDPAGDMWPYMAMWPHGGLWPYYADPYYYSTLYSPYYSAFYSPFGSWYWDRRFVEYGHNAPGFVIVDPGGGVSPPDTADGRVVNGRGYTRIRRNGPEPARVNSGDGSGWTTASTSSAGSDGSSGGSSGVSSGGYSSGGSSSSGGGRVAVPRPPGGR